MRDAAQNDVSARVDEKGRTKAACATLFTIEWCACHRQR